MGKKLTEKELREREVSKVISKIQKLEKVHSQDIVKSACYKYNQALLSRASALKAKAKAEEDLAAAERELR